MARLIAVHSIGLSKLIDAGAPADPGDPNAKPPRAPSLARPPRYDRVTLAPGTEFEAADYGIQDKDIPALVHGGSVRRKTKEVADDSVAASPTRPTGPASGATTAPDPNRVADRAMAPEFSLIQRDAAQAAEDVDYDSMNKAQLEELAAERHIDIADRRTKADIISALKGQ